MSDLLEVSEGYVFRDEANGDEFTVSRVFATRGYALLENQEGDKLTINIPRLLDAIEEGELVRVNEAIGEAEVDDEDDSLGEEEETD